MIIIYEILYDYTSTILALGTHRDGAAPVPMTEARRPGALQGARRGPAEYRTGSFFFFFLFLLIFVILWGCATYRA